MNEKGFTIYHDVLIKASTNEVFDAITLPEKLINWWPSKCAGKPRIGETYNFFFTEEYNWFGKVESIAENKSFHIKMTDADADWNPTTFGFDLSEQENGTMLNFSHKNWPKNNHHFRRSSYCWAILLKGLKSFLEEGLIIPFEKRA
ncbi:SRPBCC family protein [Croceivirga thetidis]|uniref:SRPBCC domain-containing protein n=1 Tax=Croceivirga thetidis TaxID=2721623 RepID=A0ABX1GWA2_9FLAO|nr:SRPBCC domain-containing protein [Croceivirga thetidis]NKI33291.1 SRPBCC domain-containing protein [Croceivirga thetidis]